MRLDPLPSSEYGDRVKRLQGEMKREGIEVFVGYASECESATSRFLTGFWPFFDFAGVIVPSEGRAVLVTGGPESYEFAKVFSQDADIVINPLLVETSAPQWVPEVSGESFAQILPRVCGGVPKRIGIGNWNISLTFFSRISGKQPPNLSFCLRTISSCGWRRSRPQQRFPTSSRPTGSPKRR